MGWIRTVFGAVVTAGYLIALWFLIEPKLRGWEGLDLNEVGDFLAGVFGPLAIFWLVLGYFQQGSELKQNNEALRMQASELKASVEQQMSLVNAQNKSLKNYDNALSPLLKLSAEPYDPTFIEGEPHILLSIENYGEYCERILAYIGTDTVASFPTCFKDEVRRFWLHVDGLDFACGVDIRFDYLNRNGAAGSQSFTMRTSSAEDSDHISVAKAPFLT